MQHKWVHSTPIAKATWGWESQGDSPPHLEFYPPHLEGPDSLMYQLSTECAHV